MGKKTAIVGVTEYGNSAILVTISGDGSFLDRRTVELTHGLPTMPYHHQGSWAIGRYTDSPWAKEITLPEAIDLIKKVEKAANDGANQILEQLSAQIPKPISAITLRKCPELPETIEERIRDNRAQTYADTVIYRQALARAAEARNWKVHWYDRDKLDLKNEKISAMGKIAGTPWQAKHKQAAAAILLNI